MRQQRHPARHLLWRSIIAACGNAAMATGVYPIVPHLGMMALRSWRRRPAPPGQLRALGAEWAVSLAMSAARPLGFFGLQRAARDPLGPRPIVVVHGYAMNRANFLPLARRLGGAGLGPIVGFEYWTLGSTSAAARSLGRFVDELCQRTGHERVDLIGHSMGGVVGRYYLSFGGGERRVRNLITIGAPHGGTGLSAFGVGRPTTELLPGSNLLQRLAVARVPDEVRVTAIWSRSDCLVLGPARARLPGVEEIVYDDLGHLSLLVSRRVAAAIAARLSGD